MVLRKRRRGSIPHTWWILIKQMWFLKISKFLFPQWAILYHLFHLGSQGASAQTGRSWMCPMATGSDLLLRSPCSPPTLRIQKNDGKVKRFEDPSSSQNWLQRVNSPSCRSVCEGVHRIFDVTIQICEPETEWLGTALLEDRMPSWLPRHEPKCRPEVTVLTSRDENNWSTD